MFDNPIFTKSEKFVNPATVPTAKTLTIYSDDPRNNEMYKKTCGMTVVVIEKPNNQDLTNSINDSILESELTGISQFFLNDNLVFSSSDNAQPIGLGIPQNLNIDLTNGIFTEVSANDGTVSWTAVLTFDDVPNAVSYEYSLVAI